MQADWSEGQNSRTFFDWLPALLLFGSIIARLVLTLHREFNADEFQHLHASWMIHLGYWPYRDFWENHAPLLYLLTAPVLSFLGESVLSIFIVRAIHSLAGVMILLAVYKLARLDHDRRTAFFAVAILSLAEIFIQKTIEIRTDQFLVLFWLMSLWFIFRRDNANETHLLPAGCMLGIAMLFSPKAIICYLAAAIAILVQFPRPAGGMLLRQFFFFSGMVAPSIPMALYFYLKGLAGAWIDSTLLQNLTYPDTRGPAFLLLPQNLSLLLLAFAGMALAANEQKDKFRNRPILLGICGVLPFVALVFFMPSTFSQSALTFLPLFAIYAGFALKKSIQITPEKRMTRVLMLTFCILTGFIIPVASLLFRFSQGNTNRAQMDTIKYVLNHTSPGESIFDGNAAYVFRKQAYYYGSLVEGIRYRMDRGDIPESISESLKQTQCRIVLYDDRVSDLPVQIQDFIRANYAPAEIEPVFIAGKALSAEHLNGNRAVFRIEIPLHYTIEANGGRNLRIDGNAYTKPVWLQQGVHELVSDSILRGVTIKAVTE